VLGAAKRKAVARKIGSIARSRYGNLKRRKPRPPLDQLMLSILCHHTSSSRAAKAFRQIKSRFVDWNEVRVSDGAEVADTMASASWASACAEQMREILNSLFRARNSVDMAFMDELTAAQARAFLQSLQGMGRDLADEVLLFSCNVDVLPVGDHTARVCHRLGLIPSDRATIESQKTLMSLWSADLYPNLSLFFTDHADAICQRDGPRCEKCILKPYCARCGL
jgi:endonuclease-3